MTDTLKLLIECLDWIQTRKAKDSMDTALQIAVWWSLISIINNAKLFPENNQQTPMTTPTDAISREAVLNLIDNIPDWDSKELLYGWIYSLPSLPDRTQQIKELIEKKYNEEFELHLQNVEDKGQEARWECLQELLNELYP